jgi:hypothetical protein
MLKVTYRFHSLERVYWKYPQAQVKPTKFLPSGLKRQRKLIYEPTSSLTFSQKPDTLPVAGV